MDHVLKPKCEFGTCSSATSWRPTIHSDSSLQFVSRTTLRRPCDVLITGTVGWSVPRVRCVILVPSGIFLAFSACNHIYSGQVKRRQCGHLTAHAAREHIATPLLCMPAFVSRGTKDDRQTPIFSHIPDAGPPARPPRRSIACSHLQGKFLSTHFANQPNCGAGFDFRTAHHSSTRLHQYSRQRQWRA